MPRLKVLLRAQGGKDATAHACFTDMVTVVALRVRLPLSHLGRGAEKRCKTLHALRKRFEKHLGASFHVQVRDGVRPVYAGAARLTGVELPAVGEALFAATLAFERPLEREEQIQLGLLDRPPTAVSPVEEDEVAAAPDLPIQPPRDSAPARFAPVGESESRRSASRLAIDVPLAIHTAHGRRDAEVKDISRTGLRLHIRSADLGFAPTRELEEIARGVGAVLRQTFPVDINHHRLGSLLQKSVYMTRLSVAPESSALIEICGRFDTPLALEQTTMLGVALPPPKDSDESWSPPADLQAPMARTPALRILPRRPQRIRKIVVAQPTAPAETEPESAAPLAEVEAEALGFTVPQRYRAYVRPGGESEGTSVVCQTDLIGYEGVRLRMPRSVCCSEDPAQEPAGVADVTARFLALYGAEPSIKLMKAASHLWTGPARVAAIALSPDAVEEMWVTLCFVHALRPAEIRRLGLPVSAA